jgi:hypothetical protein
MEEAEVSKTSVLKSPHHGDREEGYYSLNPTDLCWLGAQPCVLDANGRVGSASSSGFSLAQWALLVEQPSGLDRSDKVS